MPIYLSAVNSQNYCRTSFWRSLPVCRGSLIMFRNCTIRQISSLWTFYCFKRIRNCTIRQIFSLWTFYCFKRIYVTIIFYPYFWKSLTYSRIPHDFKTSTDTKSGMCYTGTSKQTAIGFEGTLHYLFALFI